MVDLKKIISLLLFAYLVSLVSVSAEEEGSLILDGKFANTIWQSGLTDFQKFMIKFNSLLSPQVTLDGIFHECSTNAYRIGEAKSGLTERKISTSTNVPAGADWIRTALRDTTNNLDKGSIFNKVGTTAIFSNLNPSITYQWFQFACFPNQAPPTTSEVPPPIEGKYYCFGNGFVDKYINGKLTKIDGKSQCSEFGNYINDCAIDLTENIPNYGNSISEVCKSTTTIPPSSTCQEGKYYCFNSGVTTIASDYSICKNGGLIHTGLCDTIGNCKIEYPSFGSSKAEVCKSTTTTPPITPPSSTCTFNNIQYKKGDKLEWKCDAFDNTKRLRQEITNIGSDGFCEIQTTEGEKCGKTLSLKQKICSEGVCVEPESGAIPYSDLKKITVETKDLKDLTSVSLLDSACRRPNECLNLKEDKDIICRPIATLRADGDLNEAQVDGFFENAGNIIKGGTIGAGIGAVACSASAVIVALGGVTAPLTIPEFVACMGLFTASGSAISTIGVVFEDSDPLVKSLKAKDASEVGICVYKDKDDGNGKSIWEQINPCVWGEQIAGEENGCLAGWGIVVIIFLIIIFVRKQ